MRTFLIPFLYSYLSLPAYAMEKDLLSESQTTGCSFKQKIAQDSSEETMLSLADLKILA